MATKKITEEVKTSPVKNTFVERKLKVLNEMDDQYKARRLAERVLANKGE